MRQITITIRKDDAVKQFRQKVYRFAKSVEADGNERVTYNMMNSDEDVMDDDMAREMFASRLGSLVSFMSRFVTGHHSPAKGEHVIKISLPDTSAVEQSALASAAVRYIADWMAADWSMSSAAASSKHFLGVAQLSEKTLEDILYTKKAPTL